MPAKPSYPRTISFENGRVRIAKRTNGKFALSWIEKGGSMKTTITDEKKAIDFAEKKARLINTGSDSQLIRASDVAALRELQAIAGPGEGSVPRLLQDLKAARIWLEGKADLATACRYYAEHGPLKLTRAKASTGITRFLAEYASGSDATAKTFGTELKAFLAVKPDLMVLDLNEEDILRKWIWRKLEDGSAPAPRTVQNRATTWVTLFNRLQEWKLLPPGPHAAQIVRDRHVPTIPDQGKIILTLAQGKKLLELVREHDPELEKFYLIAGWLGLRPTECQRLTWDLFDQAPGHLHVTAKVAGKTSQERWVPVDPRVSERLQILRSQAGARMKNRVCPKRSREFLSVLAREHGVLKEWTPDILRHSFCSYRIAFTQKISQVAEEAGNSERILKKNYRKPLRHADGIEWWRILGPDPDHPPFTASA